MHSHAGPSERNTSGSSDLSCLWIAEEGWHKEQETKTYRVLGDREAKDGNDGMRLRYFFQALKTQYSSRWPARSRLSLWETMAIIEEIDRKPFREQAEILLKNIAPMYKIGAITLVPMGKKMKVQVDALLKEDEA